jgi:hypothetical protein|tara:strand:- start:299 stop:460 length:162 start_codon:yes stop_codon:yes gene_type:complete
MTFAVDQHRWPTKATRLHHKPSSKIVSARLKDDNLMRFDAVVIFCCLAKPFLN